MHKKEAGEGRRRSFDFSTGEQAQTKPRKASVRIPETEVASEW